MDDDLLYVKLPRGMADKLAELARAEGVEVDDILNRAIKEDLDRREAKQE